MASNYNAWINFTPTFTYETSTPTGVTYVARYIRIGKLILYYIRWSASQNNYCTGFNFTVPFTATDWVPINWVFYSSSNADILAFLNIDVSYRMDSWTGVTGSSNCIIEGFCEEA